jgi:hypothetical protein
VVYGAFSQTSDGGGSNILFNRICGWEWHMNIIELAQEANGEPAWNGGVDWTWDELGAFAALVEAAARADEREACCAIVYGLCESDNVAQRTVDAIRARGTT